MEKVCKKRGRSPKPALELGSLREAGYILEEKTDYGAKCCALCGSALPGISFKNKRLCLRCLQYVKSN